MAVLTKVRHDLFPDESASADDNDFHVSISCVAHSGRSKKLLALLGRKHCRNTLVFHQEHDELRRFAVARVAPDDVNVIRAFIESFAGFERDGLGASQLHHDRTLEHVDKGVRIVSMDFVSAARRVGDRKYETFFAGNVCEGLGHDFFYVGRWSSRRELRDERISSDCDEQDDLFHGDSLWFSPDLLFFQSLTRRAEPPL